MSLTKKQKLLLEKYTLESNLLEKEIGELGHRSYNLILLAEQKQEKLDSICEKIIYLEEKENALHKS